MANHSKGSRGPDASVGRMVAWGGAAAAMILPVVLERAVSPGPWNGSDFIFLAILWVGVGVAFEVAARAKAKAYRLAVALAAAAVVLQVWINLAVGIIGSEDNPANLIYAGVIAVAACGALVARFRPLGMARAMTGAGIAQVAAFLAALVGGLGFTGPITVFFCALWLLSAWLFRRAAESAPFDRSRGRPA